MANERPAHRRPNLFILGAPKCGTTALSAYLSDHPDVFMSTPKEPFFWSDDIPVSRHELRPPSLSAYLALFAEAPPQTLILGEASTRYLRSTVAIRQIEANCPDARHVAVLRNPMEMAPAFHMEQVYVGHEDVNDFDRAWALSDLRAAGYCRPTRDPGYHYTDYRFTASYEQQIRRLFAQVPEQRRRVYLFDDLRTDLPALYRDLLAFLDVPDDGRTAFPRVNASHQQRFPSISQRLLHPPPPLQPVLRKARSHFLRRPNPVVRRAKSFLNQAYERPTISPVTWESMAETFSDDIAATERLLGRDLSAWLVRPTTPSHPSGSRV